MLDYTNVINDSNAFKMIELDAKGSRISHAYLFVCEDENYLFKFCERVCKHFINLNETENAEKNILRIEKKIHPDVKFFGEEKAIDVSAANQIVNEAVLSPFEADKKIFVLWNVHNMNEASQNKILKTIEEPPRNTYFILACKNTSRILQTILSRVKQIELDTLSSSKICQMLESRGVEKEKAEIYASCSNGNGAFAEKLAMDDGFVEFFNQVVMCFFEINGSRDVLKYSSIFNAKTVDKDEFFNIASIIVRDISMILAGKTEFVVSKNMLSKLKLVSSMLNLDATCALMASCIQAKKKLVFNVNSTAVIDDFLFKLAEVKVKCRRL